MPEPRDTQDTARVLSLQRSLVQIAFMASPTAMEADPIAFAQAAGLPPKDQAAFHRFKERLLVYRDLIQGEWAEPIKTTMPITTSLLDQAGVWAACLGAFIGSRCVESPFYRDVAPTFLGWLSATGWGQDRWPFLLQLAHSEVIHALVYHHPGGPTPAGLHTEAAPGDRLVLDPATQVVTYDYAMHLTTEEQPEPAQAPTHLLIFRDEEEEVVWKVLTPATSALLVAAQTQPIEQVVRQLGLSDLKATLALLNQSCLQGAILGFSEWRQVQGTPRFSPPAPR